MLALVCLATFAAGDCAETALNNVQPTEAVLTELLELNTTDAVRLNVPPRYMWGWGPGYAGYCGSFSTQSIGLYFGLWISAEFIRYAANTSEVLLGLGHYNMIADVFGLNVEVFNNTGAVPTISRYLDWVSAHLQLQHPVIGGVYERRRGGDSDYDHIVPLIGAEVGTGPNMALPVDPVTKRRSNVTTIWFNDLYLDAHREVSGSRLGVNRSDFTTNTWTQPYDYAFPYLVDYGVAVLGLKDPLRETFRLKLSAWSWTEPDWGAEDQCQQQSANNPVPGPLDLSATVFGLTPGTKYSILRFDGNTTAATVRQDFLVSKAWTRRWDFVAAGDRHVINLFDRVMSNTVVTYRAVLADGDVPQAPSAPQRDTGHDGGLIASRVPLALLVFAAVGVLVAGVWYLTKRYWERKNPLYDPNSTAAPARRARTASHIDGKATEETPLSGSGDAFDANGTGADTTTQLQQPLTDGDDT
eukprot:CAMPEP_0174839760 /NCGR_PEP_ID=MMETSP1114-20130205/8256_1 /TAXON_ID=312471 /ORGANISM="Neobodo designis, Strain CCAP 1951/1" /LENGTH=469 /DNA_ID=CAMNT_0016073887 /DNA_START=54 /DNA_END=1463 /DNA_ORIENTATION=+